MTKSKESAPTQGKRARLTRRKFLGSGAIVGAALVVSPALARTSNNAAPAVKSFELEETTIAELQAGMQSGKWSARELVRKYLARIAEIDKRGPTVNAIIELNPDAEGIADALDRERKGGHTRGPLHGIPVLIKDNIDTADRMKTTAGSLALAASTPPRDSFAAERLRAAGAVIIGKTNLSEWANFRSSHATSGWSGRGRQTRNPYVLDRNPCGSSSGSGVAVAANLCTVAVGTETDGSVVCPSSANSLVGIKPTLGLISRAGIIPIAHSQDTAGPMARTVADAAALLTALAGIDPRDAATQASRGKAQADYTRFLDANGLRGARIGVARKFFGFNDAVDVLLNEAIAELKRQGATIIDPADIATTGKFDDTELTVLLYEFKADLNSYLAALGAGAPVRSLKEIIDFNDKHRAEELPYFGQDLMIKAQAKGPLTSKEYLLALAKNHRLSRTEGIDATLAKFRLDALIAPTGGPVWPTDLINGDHFTGGYSTPSAVAGYPHITVPAGYVAGLPVGLSFFAGAWSEPTLIKFAYAFEQATKLRQPPKFLPTVELSAT
ncbi:MAG: amidase [Acidobacteria bacterium]|nr:MAG: amidase [Acidobacteriota bacterium]